MQGVAFLFLRVSCRLALLEYQSVNESFKLDYTYTYTILCLPVGIKVLNAVKALFTLNKKLVKQKKTQIRALHQRLHRVCLHSIPLLGILLLVLI